jgi:hypothetical protein
MDMGYETNKKGKRVFEREDVPDSLRMGEPIAWYIVSLTLGLVALMASWIPFIGLVYAPVALASLAISIASLAMNSSRFHFMPRKMSVLCIAVSLCSLAFAATSTWLALPYAERAFESAVESISSIAAESVVDSAVGRIKEDTNGIIGGIASAIGGFVSDQISSSGTPPR